MPQEEKLAGGRRGRRWGTCLMCARAAGSARRQVARPLLSSSCEPALPTLLPTGFAGGERGRPDTRSRTVTRPRPWSCASLVVLGG